MIWCAANTARPTYDENTQTSISPRIDHLIEDILSTASGGLFDIVGDAARVIGDDQRDKNVIMMTPMERETS